MLRASWESIPLDNLPNIMSPKAQSRGFFSDSIFMATSKVLSPHKYEPLRDGDESSKKDEISDVSTRETFERNTDKSARRFLILCICICLSCLIFSLIVLGATGMLLKTLLHQNSDHEHGSSPVFQSEPWKSPNPEAQRMTWAESGGQGCGHSPSEAVERGCIFDVMTTSWQHPDCYDADLNAEITALHSPWPFYWSSGPENERPTPEMLNLIPLEELGFYEGTFWATREYHVWHCTYAWRLMHRAVERGRKLDVFLMNYEHTAHCGRLIINATDYSDIPMDSPVTQATLKYPLC